MGDYRDDHSPDIALLLAVARAVKALLTYELDDSQKVELINSLDAAMKPFEHYPDPTKTEDDL